MVYIAGMSIRTILSVVITIAAFVASLGFGSRAHAWGMLSELDVGFANAHLFRQVYKGHQINYCITLSEQDISPQAGFTYKTINTEARIALREWLNAVSDLTGDVNLQRVKCSSHFVNLVIYYGAPRSDDFHPSFEQSNAFGRAHPYSYVSINTVKYYMLDGVSTPTIDFAKLLPPQMDLVTMLTWLIGQKMSDQQIVQWLGLPPDDIMKVYDNSFTFMLHEFGHAFGLCDTYAGPNNCDPNYSSPKDITEQPPSVMRCDRPVYLYPDDIEGIRQLFKRFAPAN